MGGGAGKGLHAEEKLKERGLKSKSLKFRETKQSLNNQLTIAI